MRRRKNLKLPLYILNTWHRRGGKEATCPLRIESIVDCKAQDQSHRIRVCESSSIEDASVCTVDLSVEPTGTRQDEGSITER